MSEENKIVGRLTYLIAKSITIFQQLHHIQIFAAYETVLFCFYKDLLESVMEHRKPKNDLVKLHTFPRHPYSVRSHSFASTESNMEERERISISSNKLID